jgi:FkbM family methyltransferase
VARPSRLARATARRVRSALEPPARERRRRFAHALALADGDEPELRLLRPLLPGAAFHDIGANAGLYTYWALGLGARRVVAYEPNPVSARRLRRGVGSRAEVRRVGLSDRAGSATLTVPRIDGQERRTRGTLRPGPDGGTSFEVSTVTLDDCEVEHDAVVKIDVEGHELQVLEGGAQALGAQRVATLLVELEHRQAGADVDDCLDLLGRAGYEGWAIRGPSLIPVASFDPEAHQTEADQRAIAAGGARPGSYANNFVFVRRSDRAPFLAAAAGEGFSVVDR